MSETVVGMSVLSDDENEANIFEPRPLDVVDCAESNTATAAKVNSNTSKKLEKYCVLDCNFYRNKRGKLSIKEFAAMHMPDSNRQHWVIESEDKKSELSPVQIEENQKLAERVVHGYEDGDVPCYKTNGVICKATEGHKFIFVVGNTRARIIAAIIGRPVINIRTLYEHVRFDLILNGYQRFIYDYASPCLKHNVDKQKYCPKARCSHIQAVIQYNIAAICAGNARIEIVKP